MPNHVQNTLTIVGTKTAVEGFVKKAHGVRRVTGDDQFWRDDDGKIITGGDGKPMPNPNYTAPSDLKPNALEFDCIVPLPARYSKVKYSAEGQDMERKTWGVKWGAYEQPETPPEVEPAQNGMHKATYDFTTAWGSPREFIRQASLAHQDLLFVLSYSGEGPILGCYTFAKGECVDEHAGNYNDAPEYPENYGDNDEADAEYDAEYDEWLHQYDNEEAHGIYVETMCADHIEPQ